MKKMPKYNQVSEKEYTSIKKLQEMGIGAPLASKATKRSSITIYKIYKSTSLEEYKKLASKKPIVKQEPEQLASVKIISDVVQAAKESGGTLLTTHSAFTGFDDMYDLVREASENNVTVTFVPLGKR